MADFHTIDLVDCERYRMQLTSQSCAGNWLAVEGKPDDVINNRNTIFDSAPGR